MRKTTIRGFILIKANDNSGSYYFIGIDVKTGDAYGCRMRSKTKTVKTLFRNNKRNFSEKNIVKGDYYFLSVTTQTGHTDAIRLATEKQKQDFIANNIEYLI